MTPPGSTGARVTIAGIYMVAFLVGVCALLRDNISGSTDRRLPEMIAIPAGEFVMGAVGERYSHDFTADARPPHRVHLATFLIDRTDVTNAEFASFVAATHYVTLAERKPEGLGGYLSVNQIAPGSAVFSPPSNPVPLDDAGAWWGYVSGANWRHPEGPQSSITGKDNFPVVQVAYADALAYANWAGKRLPTEAEWEYSARGGLARQAFVWGSVLRPNGRWMANTFQGTFPTHNTGEDGYIGLAPVGEFPPNKWGLYDMAGNVWQWCSDWYRADYYEQLARLGDIVDNPKGPSDSFDPDEPSVAKRVQRGGSFLCTDQYCGRFRVAARGKGSPESASNHLGFRCVKNP